MLTIYILSLSISKLPCGNGKFSLLIGGISLNASVRNEPQNSQLRYLVSRN